MMRVNVRRLLLAWLLVLPLVAGGSQLAHWLGYALATPDAAARADTLAATGHSYLAALPVLVAISVGLVAAVLLLVAFDSLRGRAQLRLQRWPFAVVPFAGFLVQELVERGAAGSAVSLAIALEKPVLIGLLLQLPFALGAFLVGYLLTRVAERLGRVLAPAGPVATSTRPRGVWPAERRLPPSSLALRAAAARGPPALPLLALS